jgi:hypothetical protein
MFTAELNYPTRAGVRYAANLPSIAKRSSLACSATRSQTRWRSVFAAINAMAELSDDWDGDGAIAPPAQVLKNASRIAEILQSNDEPVPMRVVPTVNGTVVFEWNLTGLYQEVEVEDGSSATLRRVVPGCSSANSEPFCVE